MCFSSCKGCECGEGSRSGLGSGMFPTKRLVENFSPFAQAIPRSTNTEKEKLINDILVHLPSFASQSSSETFDIVLDICRSALQADITSSPPGSRTDLKASLPLLHFASIITSSANVSPPSTARRVLPATRPLDTRLLDFYLSLLSSEGSLSGKTLEQSITPDSCIKFINFYALSYEKVELSKHTRVNENIEKQTSSLIEQLSVGILEFYCIYNYYTDYTLDSFRSNIITRSDISLNPTCVNACSQTPSSDS